MKNGFLFCLTLALLAGCAQKTKIKGEVLSGFIAAINAGDTAKAGGYLTNDFYFLSNDSKREVTRSAYLKEKSDVVWSEKITVLSSREKDSVLELHERAMDLLDSLLQAKPRKINLVEYAFRDAKISHIRLIETVNANEYTEAGFMQRMCFRGWLEHTYPEVANQNDLPADLAKYTHAYMALPKEEKMKYKQLIF